MYFEPNPNSQHVVDSLAESFYARRDQLIRFEQAWNLSHLSRSFEGDILLKWYREELRTLRADAAEFDNMLILKGLKLPAPESPSEDEPTSE
jgi:hypothetical protein